VSTQSRQSEIISSHTAKPMPLRAAISIVWPWRGWMGVAWVAVGRVRGRRRRRAAVVVVMM
jgi:hypothetical protein